jgi:hypothetical protein
VALSWQQLGVDRQHHPHRIPTAESQTRWWAWYLAEEAWPWEQQRKKPWQTDDGLRLVDMMIRLVEKGTTLTWGPGLSSDPEVRRSLLLVLLPHWLWLRLLWMLLPLLLLLMLLLLVLLGVITPGWWWWRRDRETDAPLRVVGLGAGLLGPICSLLALLDGLQNERPVSATQPASPLLFRPPGAT